MSVDLDVLQTTDQYMGTIGTEIVSGVRLLDLSAYSGLPESSVEATVGSIYTGSAKGRKSHTVSLETALTVDKPDIINQSRDCGLERHTYIYTVEVMSDKRHGVYLLTAICGEVQKHFKANLLLGTTIGGDAIRCLRSYTDSNPLIRSNKYRSRVFVEIETYTKL